MISLMVVLQGGAGGGSGDDFANGDSTGWRRRCYGGVILKC